MEKILKGKKFFTFEKWLACFTGILLVMLAVFSCNNVLVKDGGSLVIAVPGARAASASSYTIELTGTNGTTQSKTLAGGSSVQFDDLAPDTYSIVVEGKDETGVVVFYGTSSATVVAGETATVTMELQKMILGNLTVNLSETSGSTATNFTVTLTDSKNTTQSKTVASGSSIQFNNLVVGSYTVIVDGKDENDKIVMGGSSKATVVESQTASATVELVAGVGDFTGLKDAVATGGRVKVLKSIDIEESLQISNTVTILPAYQDVTLRNITRSHLIKVSTGGALTIGGGEYTITLDGNDNSNYVISAGAGCSVHLNENSIITKGSRGVNLSGGTSESSLSLAGGVITGNKNIGVYLGIKSQFDMSSGSITGNSTGVSVSAESQFSMTGGSISDNTGDGVSGSGEFTMTGGSITGNSSKGVSISNGGVFTMRDGSISDNGLDGVFVSGEFTMTDGSITGNSSTGVSISNGGAFTMEDGSITGNSYRGVYMNVDGEFIMRGGSISDNGTNGVEVSGQFTMENGSITGNSARGVSISSGGAFTMTGGSISSNTTGGVYIYKDATFTMGNGVIEENTNTGVLVYGEFTMQDGKISGNTTGGVYMYTDATFTMEGGSIEKNKRSGSGGGVSMVNGASFEMKGGSIINNSSSISGGGINIGTGASFEMTGGTIKSNTATSGNGVYLVGGNFTMGGSAIVDPDNDVSLGQNTSITVSGELTGDAVATITPPSYTNDTVVLTAGDGVTLADKIGKFAVTPNNGTEWTINESGALQQVQ